MPHRLAQPDRPLHASGQRPLTASLRYRCACANNEVLTIQVVMPSEADEQIFVWTMRQLWRDMQTEIAQHTEQGRDARLAG